jgi:hypothetical protein
MKNDDYILVLLLSKEEEMELKILKRALPL